MAVGLLELYWKFPSPHILFIFCRNHFTASNLIKALDESCNVLILMLFSTWHMSHGWARQKTKQSVKFSVVGIIIDWQNVTNRRHRKYHIAHLFFSLLIIYVEDHLESKNIIAFAVICVYTLQLLSLTTGWCFCIGYCKL